MEPASHHAHPAILTLMELVKDVFPHVPNVQVDQPANVPTALKTSSLTPTPELVLPVPPVTSDKKKSMEHVKESVIPDTSIKMVPVSSESAPLDSKTMALEDVSSHQPTLTDAKFLPSD